MAEEGGPGGDNVKREPVSSDRSFLAAFALADEHQKARGKLVSLYDLDQSLAKELGGNVLNELSWEFEARMHFKDRRTEHSHENDFSYTTGNGPVYAFRSANRDIAVWMLICSGQLNLDQVKAWSQGNSTKRLSGSLFLDPADNPGVFVKMPDMQWSGAEKKEQKAARLAVSKDSKRPPKFIYQEFKGTYYYYDPVRKMFVRSGKDGHLGVRPAYHKQHHEKLKGSSRFYRLMSERLMSETPLTCYIGLKAPNSREKVEEASACFEWPATTQEALHRWNWPSKSSNYVDRAGAMIDYMLEEVAQLGMDCKVVVSKAPGFESPYAYFPRERRRGWHKLSPEKQKQIILENKLVRHFISKQKKDNKPRATLAFALAEVEKYTKEEKEAALEFIATNSEYRESLPRPHSCGWDGCTAAFAQAGTVPLCLDLRVQFTLPNLCVVFLFVFF